MLCPQLQAMSWWDWLSVYLLSTGSSTNIESYRNILSECVYLGDLSNVDGGFSVSSFTSRPAHGHPPPFSDARLPSLLDEWG
ncbi:LOW QUALITY PROTEIN: hypothetical protein PHMEG_00029023 [Phytophthora megakarya]|uniref:Reverse transcriptase n=1 Tax=Phytophthora megakarya TaxID=4795 RepID=A0A225V5A7_9STRA|nr:LOW QUALITY PROTEIN: hypothetical protein PHMEG_00029023 [Phytophthora megakarya]